MINVSTYLIDIDFSWKERERARERQTDKETDRQTGRQTHALLGGDGVYFSAGGV